MWMMFAAMLESISIHALREEGDARRLSNTGFKINFYPRPPRGGRPLLPAARTSLFCISIHALREEGDTRPATASALRQISIHALREEGDPCASAGT